MKKIMAVLGCVAVLALGACAPRAVRSGLTDRGTSTQQQPAAPAPVANNQATDTGAADADLTNVDTMLNGIDADLSAAAQAPEDAD
jgi:hypothetical protein